MSRTFALLLITLCIPGTLALTPAQMVSVQDAAGKPRVSFQPRIVPYSATVRPIGTINLYDHKNVVDAEGQAVTGFAFYAWNDGGTIRLRVFTMVPAPGAPNRYLAENGDDTEASTRLKEFASLVVRSVPTKLDKMKALGLEPFVVVLK